MCKVKPTNTISIIKLTTTVNKNKKLHTSCKHSYSKVNGAGLVVASVHSEDNESNDTNVGEGTSGAFSVPMQIMWHVDFKAQYVSFLLNIADSIRNWKDDVCISENTRMQWQETGKGLTFDAVYYFFVVHLIF